MSKDSLPSGIETDLNDLVQNSGVVRIPGRVTSLQTYLDTYFADLVLSRTGSNCFPTLVEGDFFQHEESKDNRVETLGGNERKNNSPWKWGRYVWPPYSDTAK